MQFGEQDPATARPAVRPPAGKARSRFRLARRPWATSALLRLAVFRTALADTFEREIEAGRGFLWSPVLFGFGICLYFVLPQEPSAIALALLTVAVCCGAWAARRIVVAHRLLIVAALVAGGATAMKLRTDAVAAPVVPGELTATVTGWVASREESGKSGARIYLRVASISGFSAPDLPRTVRLTVRSRAAGIAVGDALSLTARLQPPSGPVMPGAFDFARDAYYDGIGGIGFAYGAASSARLGPAPLDIRLMQPLSIVRETIRTRIEAALDGDNGRIAAALIMGDQRGISAKTQDDMRASGLGHILSISGLHMALVAGATFWLLRALFALSTTLALGYPIKKWAAWGALAVATFYLGLSGAEVATVRSWVMLAIMLAAVIADRRAITLRNVALAAWVILLLLPDSVLSASFQMSFAATVALVSAWEAVAERRAASPSLASAGDGGVRRRVREAVSAAVLTSLIAGLATLPFGIYHFQRVAPLTLFANLATAPIVGIVVMPAALATVLAMPFGIEGLPLTLMGYGLDWMRWVAGEAARWSAGAGGVAAPPLLALLLVVAGFLWLALWQTRWRLAGLAPILCAVPLALFPARPYVLVAEDGRAAAVRGADGRLTILGGKGASFEIGNWLRADADARSDRDPTLRAGATCDGEACIAALADGRKLALVLEPDGLGAACAEASVVVTRLRAPRDCAAIVVDRHVLMRGGAVALYRVSGSDSLRLETAYPAIRRPWMPPESR